MAVFQWSLTQNENSNIDPLINLSTGRAPSSVTPADRAQLTAIAQYRNDVAGSMIDTGTANAYVLTSSSNYNQSTIGQSTQTALQTLGNNQIAFTPANTNTGASTLSIDGLGPFQIQSAPNVPLPGGVLIAGTPISLLFNSMANAFILQNFYGNPFNLPLGGMIDYIGLTAPNSAYALPFGQALSRTTFATLFALIGTTFGPGDGVTTFNIPDIRGRVTAGADNMGGTAAGRLTSASGMGTGQVGQTGGAETETFTLVTANLPPYTPAGTIAVTQNANMENAGALTADAPPTNVPSSTAAAITATFTGTPQGGTSTPIIIPTIPPMLVVNKLLRIV